MPKTEDKILLKWGLNSLSQKHKYERFALEYLKTGNATKAYKKVYPNNKTSARKYGFLTLRHPYVVHFIQKKNKQLEEKMDKEIIMNRKRILKELEDILKATKDSKKYAQALKALDQLARVVGAYSPEVSEITHKGIVINYIKPEDDGNDDKEIK